MIPALIVIGGLAVMVAGYFAVSRWLDRKERELTAKPMSEQWLERWRREHPYDWNDDPESGL